MKPIFSTEQARYQKFASFFIDVTGVSLSAESDQGSAFGNRHLLKKVDENFLALVLLLMFAYPSPLAQLFVFARCRPCFSCLCSLAVVLASACDFAARPLTRSF